MILHGIILIAKLYASYFLLVCAAFTFKLWLETRKTGGPVSPLTGK
jgi:hypothetical protein